MSVLAAQNGAGRTSWWSVLGWAAYLACSWTWCIGMFLPVLLVRDYGVWGFVVFAVPNVVGAGAMGWVLRNGAAERILQRHRAACGAFSFITIAFQCFFLGWIPLPLMGRLLSAARGEPGVLSPTWWVAGGAFIVATALAGRRGSRWMAVPLWCVSLGAGLVLWQGVAGDAWRSQDGQVLLHEPPAGLAWLAPVCAFGFALCPYLDLTFLRTRASTGAGAARAAFTIGFGAMFLAMILITLAVAPLVMELLADEVGTASRWIAVFPLLLHLVLQLSYTVTVHTQEVLAPRGWAVGLALGGMIVAAMLLGRGADAFDWHGMRGGEVIYRCFMSFYGLVFPAYVWLCMIPTADGHSGIGGAAGRRKLAVLAAACVLAAPCYWMGFIERVEWWLAPGLGMVLLARLFIRGSAASQPR